MPAVSISASARCTGSSMLPSSADESMRASSSSSASARSMTALARRITVCTAWSSTPVAVVEQRKLLLLRVIRAQLAFQVAQRQVVEREAALPGPHQIGGQRGVGGDAGQLPAAAFEVVHRELGLVQRLRLRRIGQPGGQRGLVVGVQGRGVDVAAVAVGGDDRQRGGVGVERQVGADHGQPEPAARRAVLGQPGGQLAGLERTAARRRNPGRPRGRPRPACRTAGPATPGTPGRRRADGSGRGPTAASAACRASAPAARP